MTDAANPNIPESRPAHPFVLPETKKARVQALRKCAMEFGHLWLSPLLKLHDVGRLSKISDAAVKQILFNAHERRQA